MNNKLFTPWGQTLSTQQPLPEYPRPQLKRDSYLNLNGPWDYAICANFQLPRHFDGQIIVPFSPESLLSGVGRQLKPEEVLWYRRKFSLPENFCPSGGRVLLHFGAVDQVADVYVNGQEVAHHEGGYLPFSADITSALREGKNSLTVRVLDSLLDNPYAYGKQKYKRGGIWYTATSGIWQTVWLEAVPETYIQSLRITPDFDHDTVQFQVKLSCPASVRIQIADAAGKDAGYGRCDESGQCTISLSRPHPWTPEDPHLYQVLLTAGDDRVESYFGLRKFSTMDYQGHKVLALNNRPYFHNGLLDQGYWSDGLYTPPSDEAMIHDIRTAKELGYNMLRKHIKIEPLRWYYHCDRLGMLVWQDMVSGGDELSVWVSQILPFLGRHLKDGRYKRFGRRSPLSRRIFLQDMEQTVEHLYNCTSLAVWVPFNEGWGQFDALLIAQRLHGLDPTRSIDHASGWHDQGGGDMKSCHVYYRPVRIRSDNVRVLALTEFGGYSLPVRQHHSGKLEFGYRIYRTKALYVKALQRLYQQEVIPLIESQGLSAAIYTQLSDVEDELNGLMTFDRQVQKVSPEELRPLLEQLRFSTVPTEAGEER